MVNEVEKLLRMNDRDAEAVVGQAILDDEGILSAVPHDLETLRQTCLSWWLDFRSENCKTLCRNEGIRNAIFANLGLSPLERALAIGGAIQPHFKHLIPIQIAFTSVMLVRESLQEICEGYADAEEIDSAK